MARVPIPSVGSGTELRALPGGRLDVQDQTGGLRSLGESLERLGQFGFAYADKQDEIDQTLDRTAVRQADVEAAKRIRDRLWTSDNAFYKQQGFNAANAREGVDADFGALREELRGKLTTDRQRAWFDQAYDQRVGQEGEGIARYVNGQLQVEERRQSLARITESSNDAITNWDDLDKRETAIGTALTEVRAQGAVAGWSPEVVKRAEEEARSGIYSRAIGGMIDRGDIEAAHAELIRSRDFIDPDSEVKLDAALRGPLLDREAEGIVDMLMGTAAPLQSVTVAAEAKGEVLPRMTDITAHAESRNRERDAKGNLITSPAGAQGKMQVMPGTNTDPGFGVRPAQNNSDEERTRVGRDYLAAMMKRYKNDPAKAWAAYNWGPGNLDSAVAKYGEKWFDSAPKETRDYVTGNMAQLGGRGVNAPPQQNAQEHDVKELLARVDAMELPFDVEQKVRSRLMGRVALDEQLLGREREAAQEEAWGVVESLGEKFTSINQLPANLRNKMTAQQRRAFEAEADRNANQPRETNWQAYAKYSDMAATDPAGFAKLNPAELRRNLGDGDFEQVMGWRRSVQGAIAGGGKSPDQVTLSRIKDVTDPLMIASGLTRPPDPIGSKQRDAEADAAYYKRVGQFQRRMTDDLARWQKNNPGKEPDDNVIRDLADRNLLKMYRKDPKGKATGEVFDFERTPGSGGYYYQRPNVETQRIIGAYRKRWGRNPTETEIDQIYRFGPRGGAK